jgi:formylglycine-generating enzyme required for sulfatase activity
MVDWYEAMGQCAAKGKRLCYESEWTAACEGPNETPFPHGFERSAEKCNIDNRWITPTLSKTYSKDPSVRDPELKRLDQSVPSGSKPDCVSGYGVYDLTGNFDEWTIADRDRPEEKAVFVALKGGAWGHVRNACRPVTTSHEPEFSYYFVSFRCCKDAASVKPYAGSGG